MGQKPRGGNVGQKPRGGNVGQKPRGECVRQPPRGPLRGLGVNEPLLMKWPVSVDKSINSQNPPNSIPTVCQHRWRILLPAGLPDRRSRAHLISPPAVFSNPLLRSL